MGNMGNFHCSSRNVAIISYSDFKNLHTLVLWYGIKKSTIKYCFLDLINKIAELQSEVLIYKENTWSNEVRVYGEILRVLLLTSTSNKFLNQMSLLMEQADKDEANTDLNEKMDAVKKAYEFNNSIKIYYYFGNTKYGK